MSGAGNETKELWNGVQEVENLGNEEEEHCLAEVREDSDHRECHSGKVAESVTYKHL